MLLWVCSWQLFAQTYSSSADVWEDGTYLWRRALGGVVIGQPDIRERSVAVITDGGSLRTYSLTGAPLWNFSARRRLAPFLTGSPEGTSYIAGIGGILIAVNGSGRELWRANLGGELSGPVVIGRGGRVFAPTSTGVSCYTASGTLLWRRNFGHAISAGPEPDGAGGIVLALENGEVLRIDPFGGLAGWSLSSPPSMLVPLSSRDGPAILALHGDGGVLALDPARPGDDPVVLPGLPSRPLAAASRGSRAAVVLSSGQTFMVSAGGEVLWTGDSHIGVQGRVDRAAVVYDGHGVYVLSPGGATGFSGCGDRLWLTSLVNVSGLPAFGGRGMLLSGGTDWILYAWRLENRAAAERPSGRTAAGSADFTPSSFSATPMRFNDAMVGRELDAVQRGIREGRVGGNELEWIAFLKETAEGGTRPDVSRANPDRLIALPHRLRALQLLGGIGSAENVPWLVRFFGREQNPVVRAGAVRAIGEIGADPDGRALQAFTAFAAPGNALRDERVLLSVASAAGAICRFSGSASYDAGVRLLVMLGAPNQPAAVRRQAGRELESIRAGP